MLSNSLTSLNLKYISYSMNRLFKRIFTVCCALIPASQSVSFGQGSIEWRNNRGYEQVGPGVENTNYQQGQLSFLIRDGAWTFEELPEDAAPGAGNTTLLWPTPGRRVNTIGDPINSSNIIVEDDARQGVTRPDGNFLRDIEPVFVAAEYIQFFDKQQLLRGTRNNKLPGGIFRMNWENRSAKFRLDQPIEGVDGAPDQQVFDYADYLINWTFNSRQQHDNEVPGVNYIFAVPNRDGNFRTEFIIKNDGFAVQPHLISSPENPNGQWIDGVFVFNVNEPLQLTWSDFFGQPDLFPPLSPTAAPNDQVRLSVVFDDTDPDDPDAGDTRISLVPEFEPALILFNSADVQTALNAVEDPGDGVTSVTLANVAGSPNVAAGGGNVRVGEMVREIDIFTVFTAETVGVSNSSINAGQSITISPESAMLPQIVSLVDLGQNGAVRVTGVSADTGEIIIGPTIRAEDLFPDLFGIPADFIGVYFFDGVFGNTPMTSITFGPAANRPFGLGGLQYLSAPGGDLRLDDGRQTQFAFEGDFFRSRVNEDTGVETDLVGQDIDVRLLFSRNRSNASTSFGVLNQTQNALSFKIRPVETFPLNVEPEIAEAMAEQPDPSNPELVITEDIVIADPKQRDDFLRFALKLDSDAKPVPTIDQTSTGAPRIRFNKRASSKGAINYAPEYSTDLKTWLPIAADNPNFTIVQDDANGFEAHANPEFASSGGLFMRLRVQQKSL